MAPEKVLCDWSERALDGQDGEKFLKSEIKNIE